MLRLRKIKEINSGELIETRGKNQIYNMESVYRVRKKDLVNMSKNKLGGQLLNDFIILKLAILLKCKTFHTWEGPS